MSFNYCGADLYELQSAFLLREHSISDPDLITQQLLLTDVRLTPTDEAGVLPLQQLLRHAEWLIGSGSEYLQRTELAQGLLGPEVSSRSRAPL